MISLANHVNSTTVVARLLYLGFAELLVTVVYFLDFYKTKKSPSFIANPVTDFLVMVYEAQSAS